MRSAVGETARKDADGASERRDNEKALSITRLRAARGTGIYEQFPPPCHFQRTHASISTVIHINDYSSCMYIASIAHAHQEIFM